MAKKKSKVKVTMTLLYQAGNPEGQRIQSFLEKKKKIFRTVNSTDYMRPTLIIPGKTSSLIGEKAIKARFK